MQNRRSALLALTVLSGILVWRNRFAIQRQLEARGLKTPLFKGSLEESAQSVASKMTGKMERGATIAENMVNKTAV